MSAAKLKSMEGWADALIIQSIAWAVNNDLIRREVVDKACTEDIQPTARLDSIDDEHVAFTIDFMGNKYPVHYRMPVALLVVQQHFHMMENTNAEY